MEYEAMKVNAQLEATQDGNKHVDILLAASEVEGAVRIPPILGEMMLKADFDDATIILRFADGSIIAAEPIWTDGKKDGKTDGRFSGITVTVALPKAPQDVMPAPETVQ